MNRQQRRKIERMHELFGRCEAHKCRECEHFVRGMYHDKILHKCEVYGLTHSEASDWVGRYDACGLYNRPYDGRPIIECRQYTPAQPEPLPGQISIMDLGEEAGT